MTHYASWRDVPESAWRWKNFSPREMACRGTGRLLVNEDAMDRLQALRDELGVPLIIRSAYRSPEHNRSVGGATRSKHMDGIAFDVAVANHNPSRFITVAQRHGFRGIGTYPRSGFIHVDTRENAASWGDPFPMSDTNLPTEAPRQPESVTEDREAQVITGAGGLLLLNEVVSQVEKSSNIIERLADVSPLTLIAIAGLGYVVWKHLRGKRWKSGD